MIKIIIKNKSNDFFIMRFFRSSGTGYVALGKIKK